MKKIVFCLVAFAVFSSCEDIKMEDSLLQVSVGENFLRTENPTAVLHTDGSLTLSGTYENQTLKLTITSQDAGVYTFGTSNSTVGYYKIEEEQSVLEYSTIEGVVNPQLESNLGQINIYPAGHIKASKNQGTISGEFRFRAKILGENESDIIEPTIFFHQGFFYNLKVEKEQ